jgi:hypothetical protein
MRNFVISDIHGFCREMASALAEAGYEDSPDTRLIVLGDCWDRGPDPYGVYRFLCDRMRRGNAILIKGNHEYLMADRLIRGFTVGIDLYNGVDETLKVLTKGGMGTREITAWINGSFWKDYAEIDDYVFVHGWVPLDGFDAYRHDDIPSYQYFTILPDWRTRKDRDIWKNASWENGVKAFSAGILLPGKTVVCGHRNAATFHAMFDERVLGSGMPTEDFSIFRAPGCIAIDGHTVRSGKVNVLVIETR